MAIGIEGERVGRLERVDRFATHLITRAPSVRFRLALADEEREAVYRLRYQVVVERGWVSPAGLPNGIERDADDDHAVLIAGWDGDRIVAAGRMLVPTPERRLPIERVFDLTIEPGSQAAHIDRLCVARSHREPGHRVFAALIGRCWLELRARGYRCCYGIKSAAMVRLFQQVGLTVVPLGPSRRYWNELRFPVRFDPSATTQAPSHAAGAVPAVALAGPEPGR